MPWLLVGLAGVVLGLAGLAATGRWGEMPEPPVEDVWNEPVAGTSGGASAPVAGDPPDRSLPHAG